MGSRGNPMMKMSEERKRIKAEVVPLLLAKQITYIAAKAKYGVPKITLKKWVEKEQKKINELIHTNRDRAAEKVFQNLLTAKQIRFLVGLDECHEEIMDDWKKLYKRSDDEDALENLSPIAAEEKFKGKLLSFEKLQKIKMDFLKFTMEFSDFKDKKDKEQDNSPISKQPIDVTPTTLKDDLSGVPASKLSEIQRQTAKILSDNDGTTTYDKIAAVEIKKEMPFIRGGKKLIRTADELAGEAPEDF
jgi:hypothetical protein